MEKVRRIENIKDRNDCGNSLYEWERVKIIDDNCLSNYFIIYFIIR